MEEKVSRSTYLAHVISRVTNPCIHSVLLLLLIAYAESTDFGVLAYSVTIVLLFLVLIPLVYVYLRMSRSRISTRLPADPTFFLRHHPKDVLILGLLLGLPCLAILYFLEAPSPMLHTLVALLASSIATALFNMFYRVSYHLAAVTVLVIMAALTWGQIFLVLLVTIPVIGWAKYQIKQHTLAQLATGTVLSLAIVGALLYLPG
ncbi:MAG TPA: hypothetical protein G4O20_01345 [Dehalococcoidia bacterium]|nr:MAG: hypothetical protein AMJ43_00435 [Coxiella sp. DG_40]HEY50434.1 hypothetical protein [Dehalococcoidia bacterium]